MIKIEDKQNCCGCSACVQICPKHCIIFEEDENGFYYPHVNTENCINCGLCDKACPYLNPKPANMPIKVYAAQNTDESIRKESSSGGIFSMLASKTIEEGGVVFGAKFNEEWEVIHDYTETIEKLWEYRGSKYVQSKVGETFKQVESFLLQGRKVLFSGTPCQIAGLKLFLRKEYDNLTTIDIICHGVPSALVWKKYLDETVQKKSNGLFEKKQIQRISFRNKAEGWFNYGLHISGFNEKEKNKEVVFLHESKYKSLYLQAFIKNLCLRSSCHNCPSKCGKSGSDITLGDFWFLKITHPEMDDDKGTSIVLANTQKGLSLIQAIHPRLLETSYEEAYKHNKSIEKSTTPNIYNHDFWQSFHLTGFADIRKILRKTKKNFFLKILQKLKGILTSI